MLSFLGTCMWLTVQVSIGSVLIALALYGALLIFCIIGFGGGAFKEWVRKPKFTKK